MKLEIKTKCAECDEVVGHLTERGVNETILFVNHCPNCHPAKSEKITPKEGEWVEVRDMIYHAQCFSNAMATGRRSEWNDEILVTFGVGFCPTSYNVWRYPGETEWRD